MKVPAFYLSAADQAALDLCKACLEGLAGPHAEYGVVAVVRWCIHRAAAGVAAAMTEEEHETDNADRT